jgi:DNA-directed RNA polymerase subunit K/omega
MDYFDEKENDNDDIDDYEGEGDIDEDEESINYDDDDEEEIEDIQEDDDEPSMDDERSINNEDFVGGQNENKEEEQNLNNDDYDDDEYENQQKEYKNDDDEVENDGKTQNMDEERSMEEEEEEEENNYFQKFNNELNKNYIKDSHPECIIQNYDEINVLTNIIRDINGIIIDDLHKTIPYLTKYEKTKILGLRASQINNGAKPYITISQDLIDGYVIAQEELKQKKIPFILRRPMVGGKMEFWKVSDLEQIDF